MTRPSSQALKQACEVLAGCDPHLAKAYERVGVPEWRTRPADFETLARLVTYQLISTNAADAVWGRTAVFLGQPVLADALLAADMDELRACGLSRPKIGHMRSIATAIETGALDLEQMAEIAPDAVRTMLLKVKGIGPWTADLFLLSAYGQVDAFPAGDVGHMEAYHRLSGSEARMQTKAFVKLAENWRPFRGVAAHLLWGWLNAERQTA